MPAEQLPGAPCHGCKAAARALSARVLQPCLSIGRCMQAALAFFTSVVLWGQCVSVISSWPSEGCCEMGACLPAGYLVTSKVCDAEHGVVQADCTRGNVCALSKEHVIEW